MKRLYTNTGPLPTGVALPLWSSRTDSLHASNFVAECLSYDINFNCKLLQPNTLVISNKGRNWNQLIYIESMLNVTDLHRCNSCPGLHIKIPYRYQFWETQICARLRGPQEYGVEYYMKSMCDALHMVIIKHIGNWIIDRFFKCAHFTWWLYRLNVHFNCIVITLAIKAVVFKPPARIKIMS